MYANVTSDIPKNGLAVEFTMNYEDPDLPKEGDVKFEDRVTAPGNIRMITKVGTDGTCHVIEAYSSPGVPGFSNTVRPKSG